MRDLSSPLFSSKLSSFHKNPFCQSSLSQSNKQWLEIQKLLYVDTLKLFSQNVMCDAHGTAL